MALSALSSALKAACAAWLASALAASASAASAASVGSSEVAACSDFPFEALVAWADRLISEDALATAVFAFSSASVLSPPCSLASANRPSASANAEAISESSSCAPAIASGKKFWVSSWLRSSSRAWDAPSLIFSRTAWAAALVGWAPSPESAWASRVACAASIASLALSRSSFASAVRASARCFRASSSALRPTLVAALLSARKSDCESETAFSADLAASSFAPPACALPWRFARLISSLASVSETSTSSRALSAASSDAVRCKRSAVSSSSAAALSASLAASSSGSARVRPSSLFGFQPARSSAISLSRVLRRVSSFSIRSRSSALVLRPEVSFFESAARWSAASEAALSRKLWTAPSSSFSWSPFDSRCTSSWRRDKLSSTSLAWAICSSLSSSLSRSWRSRRTSKSASRSLMTDCCRSRDCIHWPPVSSSPAWPIRSFRVRPPASSSRLSMMFKPSRSSLTAWVRPSACKRPARTSMVCRNRRI